MYVKLAIRNAKRSVFDYLLYITTTVMLLAFMHISNYVAIIANIEAGFQSASLPFLISIILVILVSYINKYMLRQRSREFATYILLGMEKRKLVRMFLYEFTIIGFFCFIVSNALCFGADFALSHIFQSAGGERMKIGLYLQSSFSSLIYFCFLEILSMRRMKRQICLLEISELMVEKKRNQSLGGKKQCQLWGIVFLVHILIIVLLLFGIAFLPNELIMKIISLIFVPLTFTVFAFYKWLYHYTSLIRQKQPEGLYQRDRLYVIAKISSGANANSSLNSIFCICLLLSSMSYIVGAFMLQTKALLFDENIQKWMGFLQICLCIIFIVIYFSILSLQQMIDSQQQMNELRILHYLGKSNTQLKKLVRNQIMIKLLMPAIMCFILLGISMPFLNYKLNNTLPLELRGLLLKSFCEFSLCFLLLYLLYFFIDYALSKNVANLLN